MLRGPSLNRPPPVLFHQKAILPTTFLGLNRGPKTRGPHLDAVFKQSDPCSAGESYDKCRSACQKDKSLVPADEMTSPLTCSAMPGPVASSPSLLPLSNQQIADALPRTHISAWVFPARPVTPTPPAPALLRPPHFLQGPFSGPADYFSSLWSHPPVHYLPFHQYGPSETSVGPRHARSTPFNHSLLPPQSKAQLASRAHEACMPPTTPQPYLSTPHSASTPQTLN